MPPITIGRVIAFLVLIVAVVFAATKSMPLEIAGLFIGLAIAMLVP